MPMNRGQGQSTRWYQLCFAPTGADSSDSDTESIVLPPSTPAPTSTWQELSPPETPPPPTLPPPPPPPPFLLPPPPPLPVEFWDDEYVLESPPHGIYQPRSPSHAFMHHNPFDSSSVVEPEADQSEFSQVLPDGIINAIRRVRISELDERDKQSHNNCPICMEEFKVGDQACHLPCIHVYHPDCIHRWLNNNKTCPICRLQLDGLEGQIGSYSIADNSLDPEPPTPPSVTRIDWDFFSLYMEGSQVSENSAGDNSDEDGYHSACDELSDSHEDGGIVGAS